MKDYLIGILVFVSLMFVLNGIRGEFQESSKEDTVETVYTTFEDHLNSTGNVLNSTSEHFSFDLFNLKFCDVLAAPSVSFRGTNSPKNIKFTSTIQLLSTHSTPLSVRSSKNLYFHYSFVKFSYRYFIYTLRRLLI